VECRTVRSTGAPYGERPEAVGLSAVVLSEADHDATMEELRWQRHSRVYHGRGHSHWQIGGPEGPGLAERVPGVVHVLL